MVNRTGTSSVKFGAAASCLQKETFFSVEVNLVSLKDFFCFRFMHSSILDFQICISHYF